MRAVSSSSCTWMGSESGACSGAWSRAIIRLVLSVDGQSGVVARLAELRGGGAGATGVVAAPLLRLDPHGAPHLRRRLPLHLRQNGFEFGDLDALGVPGITR